MGSMVLDAVRVNAFILPNLTKAKNSLTEAAKYGNSVERYAGDSPISSRSNVNAARVRNLASNLTKRLGTISSNINTVSVKLDAKLEKAKPVLKTLPGWKCDIRGIKKYEDLPENCRKYIEFIEEQIGYPITMVSNGPGRHDIIFR